MDIFVVKTPQGLVPAFDEDHEKLKRIKSGQAMKVKVTRQRNVDFHRKYFSLINTAWAYQQERSVEHFKHNVTLFRKTIEIAAGHCEVIYSISRKEWIETPKSIAFDKMEQHEFDELYDRVKDVLFAMFLSHVSRDEFMQNLANY